MLFSKVSDSMTEYTLCIWTPKGIAITGVKDFCQVKATVKHYTTPALYGEGAFLVCIFRCPTAKFTSSVYAKMFYDVKIPADGKRKSLYKLTYSQMWEVYRGWRRAYAQGYSATDSFNLAGPTHHNLMTNVGSHFTFDVRLGYLLVTDKRMHNLIGEGPDEFKLKVSRFVE